MPWDVEICCEWKFDQNPTVLFEKWMRTLTRAGESNIFTNFFKIHHYDAFGIYMKHICASFTGSVSVWNDTFFLKSWILSKRSSANLRIWNKSDRKSCFLPVSPLPRPLVLLVCKSNPVVRFLWYNIRLNKLLFFLVAYAQKFASKWPAFCICLGPG